MASTANATDLEWERERFNREMELKRAELELRRSELEFKLKAEKKWIWTSPLAVSLVAGIISIIVAIVGNIVQTSEKLKSDLILKSIQADPEDSAKNLLFLLDAGLITDSTGTILKLRQRPQDAPVSSSPSFDQDRISQLNEKRLEGLRPEVAALARRFIAQAKASGIVLVITRGYVSVEEQDGLYALGRTKPGQVITSAKGGESVHNYGIAFDVVPLDSVGKAEWDTTSPSWVRLVEIGKSLGLEWGGDWPAFKDVPHFQYGSLAEERKKQNSKRE